MTDQELVARRLAFIETCLRELRELARPSQLQQDVREQRFVEHTLQLAIQAALDVASHIVSDDRLGEPATNRQLFDRLVTAGWIPAALGDYLVQMASFRDILVHGYANIDLEIVEDILLQDLEAFVSVVRARLGQRG